MKTTIEIPDSLFRKAKAAAAEEGTTLKDYVTDAILHKVRRKTGTGALSKPWEKGFGALRDLRQENRRIQRLISAEFETIDEEEWR